MICAICELTHPDDARFCTGCAAPLRLTPRFSFVRLLGQGAQKRVYQARDTRLARDVAISVIRTETLDAQSRSRLEREARTMGRLGHHPNVVAVYDVVSDEGNLCVISQYVDGGSLAELIAAQGSAPIPVRRVLGIALDLCRGLQHAHACGIVHRDLKPANVYMRASETAMLGDFGIAFLMDESRLTQTGLMVGTPAYSAPEQLQGRAPDARADLYALGVLIYELLAGCLPFAGQGLAALLSQQLFSEPTPIEQLRSDLSPGVAALVRALLRKRPQDRPESAAQVAQELEGLLQGLDAPAGPPSSASQRTAATEVSAERRQLSMMVIELADSRSREREADVEHVNDVLRGFRTTCEQVIGTYEGRLGPWLGEKLSAYFGYPLAHEDDACRAVHAALELVARLPTGARIGIHSGVAIVDVEASPKSDPILGASVGLAERLQQAVEPSTVAISATTLRLVDGRFVVSDLPSGLEGYRVERFSAAGTSDAAHAGDPRPLVARERELGLLLDGFREAQKGRGHVVFVAGEAGLGKSRLIRALRDALTGTSGTWLQCAGSPYHQNSVLHPVRELLRVGLELEQDDITIARAAPLLAHLLSLPQDVHPAAPALDAEQGRRQMLDTVLSLVMRWTRKQPVVLVVEDLHWIDPSTLELIELLIGRAPTSNLLIVLSSRPSFVPPWINRSSVTHLTLRPLAVQQVEEMIGALSAARELPDSARAQIVARSDGVPLFVEELTRMVLESTATRAGSAYELSVPATLQDSLMARLDRIGSAKGVAQLASVIGREFSYELLRALSTLDDAALRESLRVLVEGEHLYLRGDPPHEVYVFRHALIQEAAHGSLLRSTRMEAHGKVLDALRVASDASPELLAFHAEEAGRGAEAVQHWCDAAARARSSAAYVESARHLQRALQLVATLPASLERDRSELVVTTALLGGGWRHGLKAEEASRLFERGVELARNLQRADSEAGLHGSYGRLLAASGSADAYVAHVERALEIVHGGPEDQTLPLQAQLSHAMRRAGRLEEGLALGDQVIARLQGPEQRLRGFDFSPLIWLRALRAQTWIWTGRWQQADVELRSLLALDPGLSSLDLRTLLAYLCAELALMRSDADGLLPIVQVALRLAEPHGSSYALALARTAMGIAELLEGRWEQAEDLFGSTFELTQRTGAGQELGMSLLALQAECRLRRGDPPAALRTAGAALEEARKREMRYYTGMVRLCYARTLLRQDEARLDEAERALDEVEKLGREIGAGSYLPFLEAERAQLALRRGDDPAYRRHLAVSLQMFDELGAPRRS